ncbi:MAG: archaeosortase A [Candidatus Thermoplasmatota archaeon]|nr:archaeosortase A [Candidatus Thermoplasmatota archaeon]
MLEPLSLLFGLIFLETGWLLRAESKAHLSFSIGWLLFGIYWSSLIPGYLEINDYFNAVFCSLAIPFFLYISLNEIHLYSRGKRVKGMETVALGSFIAALTYFLIEYITPLASFLKSASAREASTFARALGVSTAVEGNFVLGAHTTFEIVLACTALQSIMIFVGFIVASQEVARKRVIAATVMGVVIYLLNIVRNGGIIFLSESGIMDFNTAHNLLGKTASLVAMFLLALFVLSYLPSLYDSFAEFFVALKPKKLKLVARGGGFALLPLLLSPFVSYLSVDVSLILTMLSFLVVLFFRDPDRSTGRGIVSPADGKVLYAFDDNGTKRIAIFMSITDVHVNRAPCSGEVLRVDRGKGTHAPAYSKNAEKNVYALIDMGRIKIKQITGIFARRIVTYVRREEPVKKGERIGLIRFGSRVDLYAEVDGRIMVKKGDKVIAGETTLIEHME